MSNRVGQPRIKGNTTYYRLVTDPDETPITLHDDIAEIMDRLGPDECHAGKVEVRYVNSNGTERRAEIAFDGDGSQRDVYRTWQYSQQSNREIPLWFFNVLYRGTKFRIKLDVPAHKMAIAVAARDEDMALFDEFMHSLEGKNDWTHRQPPRRQGQGRRPEADADDAYRGMSQPYDDTYDDDRLDAGEMADLVSDGRQGYGGQGYGNGGGYGGGYDDGYGNGYGDGRGYDNNNGYDDGYGDGYGPDGGRGRGGYDRQGYGDGYDRRQDYYGDGYGPDDGYGPEDGYGPGDGYGQGGGYDQSYDQRGYGDGYGPDDGYDQGYDGQGYGGEPGYDQYGPNDQQGYPQQGGAEPNGRLAQKRQEQEQQGVSGDPFGRYFTAAMAETIITSLAGLALIVMLNLETHLGISITSVVFCALLLVAPLMSVSALVRVTQAHKQIQDDYMQGVHSYERAKRKMVAVLVLVIIWIVVLAYLGFLWYTHALPPQLSGIYDLLDHQMD